MTATEQRLEHSCKVKNYMKNDDSSTSFRDVRKCSNNYSKKEVTAMTMKNEINIPSSDVFHMWNLQKEE